MQPTKKLKIGIIGAGRLGTALARISLESGYEVRVSNSRGPESLELAISVLIPGAIATTIEESVRVSDIIILAVPLGKYDMFDPAIFDEKILIDAMNYWSPVEGVIDAFVGENVSSSSVLQKYFEHAKIVKTLNHIAYNELEDHRLPAGSADRRAVFVTSDNESAKGTVIKYIDDIGFDPVDLGGLAEGHRYQPDTDYFNARLTKQDS